MNRYVEAMKRESWVSRVKRRRNNTKSTSQLVDEFLGRQDITLVHFQTWSFEKIGWIKLDAFDAFDLSILCRLQVVRSGVFDDTSIVTPAAEAAAGWAFITPTLPAEMRPVHSNLANFEIHSIITACQAANRFYVGSPRTGNSFYGV
jgi:hypothetical protein